MKKIFKIISTSFLTLFLKITPIYAAPDISIEKPTYGITTSDELINTISTLIKVAFGIAAFLCFVYLLWGGVQWITSGGDKAKYEEARNRITAAIIGLAIVAAAWAVMLIAGNLLGLQDLLTGGGVKMPGLPTF